MEINKQSQTLVAANRKLISRFEKIFQSRPRLGRNIHLNQ